MNIGTVALSDHGDLPDAYFRNKKLAGECPVCRVPNKIHGTYDAPFLGFPPRWVDPREDAAHAIPDHGKGPKSLDGGFPCMPEAVEIDGAHHFVAVETTNG